MNKTPKAAGQIAAVIVAYHPDQGLLLRNIRAVSTQVFKVYVWDNTTPPARIDELPLPKNVLLITNGDNSGIAQPLNIVATLARGEGFEWLLTLDQDSVLAECYVSRMLQFVAEEADDRLVSLGGALDEPGSQCKPVGSANVSSLITSGNLIRLDALDAVGGFDETFFIDCVDHDVSLKLRAGGYRLAQLQETRLEHTIGDPLRVRIPGIGKTVSCSNHSAIRRYYSCRNRLMLYRRYWRLDPGFVCRDMYAMGAEIVKIVFFEQDKLKKLHAAFRGLLDAVLGRYGQCEYLF